MQKMSATEELSPEKIQALIIGWVRESLDGTAKKLSQPVERNNEDHTQDPSNNLNWEQSVRLRDLARGRHVESMGHAVDLLLHNRGIKLEKGSDAYRQLCRELLKASIKILEDGNQRTYHRRYAPPSI